MAFARNVLVLLISGVVSLGLGLGVLGSEPLAGLILLAMAAALLYTALYQLQVGRASAVADQVVAASRREAQFSGPRGPAWIWHGNGVLLVVGADEIGAVDVPLLRAPVLLWTQPRSAVRRVQRAPGPIADLLRIETQEEEISIRTFEPHAEHASAVLEGRADSQAGEEDP